MTSPYFRDYLRYGWYLLKGHYAETEKRQAAKRQEDLSPYLNGGGHLRILDLGNGRLQQQYTLLRAAGHQVYGIDLANCSGSTWEDMAYQTARSVFRWQVDAPRGRLALQTLVRGDVGTLPFADGYFDLVVSANAFEHFLDVRSVVAELYRVLRPGGLVWVSIHLFPSLSGGHNLSFTEMPVRTLAAGVDRWDHLRCGRLPIQVPLNKWRRDQYLEAFSQCFRILKQYCAAREGEELLTQALRAEIASYSLDDLTCRACVIVAKKAPSPTRGTGASLSAQVQADEGDTLYANLDA